MSNETSLKAKHQPQGKKSRFASFFPTKLGIQLKVNAAPPSTWDASIYPRTRSTSQHRDYPTQEKFRRRSHAHRDYRGRIEWIPALQSRK